MLAIRSLTLAGLLLGLLPLPCMAYDIPVPVYMVRDEGKFSLVSGVVVQSTAAERGRAAAIGVKITHVYVGKKAFTVGDTFTDPVALRSDRWRRAPAFKSGDTGLWLLRTVMAGETAGGIQVRAPLVTQRFRSSDSDEYRHRVLWAETIEKMAAQAPEDRTKTAKRLCSHDVLLC